MKIQLSDHFNYRRLFRFVLPSIVMMIFTSIYGVVDGLFVSNYVGKTEFAAVNFIMPLLMLFSSIGFMFGTGGSAVVSKTVGEVDIERANRYFSMFVKVCIIVGIIITVLGQIFLRPAAILMGADEEMVEHCVVYGRIILASLVPFMLQNLFQSFLVAAEKPQIGLAVTIGAGVTNMFLDFLFIAVFKWGVAGAAIATALSQCVGGLVPFVYFIRKNSSLFRLKMTKIEPKIILSGSFNGASELMTQVSLSIVNMLYNYQLMNIAGQDGVAAYGVIMYVNFIFTSIFIGYSIGSAPIVGYNYGAQNHKELNNMLRKSLIIIGLSGVLLTLAAFFSAPILSAIFVSYDKELFDMTVSGFKLFSLSFMICGFNIYGSAFFTALGNGLISALISFIRTLVCACAADLLRT